MKDFTRLQTVLKEHPMLPVALGIVWNLAYAVFNATLGISRSSWWFITLAVFYALLGLMRLSVVTIGKNGRWKETSVMRMNGAAIASLSIVFTGITILTIRQQQNPVRNHIVMIAIAAFTFAFVVLSIRDIIRAHRERSALLITLRNIDCVTAAGAVLSLEREMLGTFGNAADSLTVTAEAVSGAIAFLLMIGLGIGLILHSREFEKKQQT